MRVAQKITKKQLKNIIDLSQIHPMNTCQYGFLDQNHPQTIVDLDEVLFDKENFEILNVPKPHKGFSKNDINQLLGYQSLPNGLSFIGGFGGGDWEHPVFFIIYFDGNKLRAYIPKHGNTFNPVINVAFGSESEYSPNNSDNQSKFTEDDVKLLVDMYGTEDEVHMMLGSLHPNPIPLDEVFTKLQNDTFDHGELNDKYLEPNIKEIIKDIQSNIILF